MYFLVVFWILLLDLSGSGLSGSGSTTPTPITFVDPGSALVVAELDVLNLPEGREYLLQVSLKHTILRRVVPDIRPDIRYPAKLLAGYSAAGYPA